MYQLESKYKVLQKKYDKQQGDSHNSSIGLLSADNSFTISSREHKEFKMLKYEIDRLKRSEQKMRTEILEKDKLIDSLKADVSYFILLTTQYISSTHFLLKITFIFNVMVMILLIDSYS